MGTPPPPRNSRINFQYEPDLLCHNYCHIFSYFILYTKQSCEETDEDKQVVGVLCPFLIGRMFVREPSWKYSANLVGS